MEGFQGSRQTLFSQVSAAGRMPVCHQKLNTEVLSETQKAGTHLLVPGLRGVGLVPSYLEGKGCSAELPIG